jgi:MFS family permease
MSGSLTSSSLRGQNSPFFLGSLALTFNSRLSAAFQPLYGQCANIFGRRWVTLVAVSIFVLGSGISGGSTNVGMLIAGRAVQGTGSGGMVMMVRRPFPVIFAFHLMQYPC